MGRNQNSRSGEEKGQFRLKWSYRREKWWWKVEVASYLMMEAQMYYILENSGLQTNIWYGFTQSKFYCTSWGSSSEKIYSGSHYHQSQHWYWSKSTPILIFISVMFACLEVDGITKMLYMQCCVVLASFSYSAVPFLNFSIKIMWTALDFFSYKGKSEVQISIIK